MVVQEVSRPWHDQPMANRAGVDRAGVSSFAEIARRSADSRALLQTLGVRLNPVSALGALLMDAERIAAEFAAGEEGSGQDVVRIAHADRVTSAVLEIGTEPAALQCLQRMTSGAMDLGQRTPSSGKDALWELELVAWLRRRGFAANLEEPDVVVQVMGQPYPIACKKIYSLSNAESQFRSAIAQLKRSGRSGLVAFNLDDLTPEVSVFLGQDFDQMGEALASANRGFIDQHARVFGSRVADGRCDGVLAATTVVADVAIARPRTQTFLQATLWTLPEPNGPRSYQFSVLRDQLTAAGFLGG